MKQSHDSLLTSLLALSAGIGSLSLAAVMVEHGPEGERAVSLGLFAALVFGPAVHALLEEWRLLPGYAGTALGWLLQALLVLVTPMEVRLAALAILGFGHLYFRSRRNLEAALCAAAGPLGALAGLALAPHAGLVPMLLLAIVIAASATPLLHGRATEERARAAAGPRETLGRLVLGPVLTVLALVTMLPLLVGIEGAREVLEARSSGAGTESSAGETSQDGDGEDEDARDSGSDGLDGAAPGSAKESIDYSDGLGASVLSDAEVLRVRHVDSVGPARPGQVLYLRDLVLDRFTRDGITVRDSRPPPLLRDVTDGSRDGWVTVAGPLPGATVRELEFEARPLRLERRRWTLLFAPRPLLAVDVEPVRLDPDGPSVVDGVFDGWFAYRARYAEMKPSWAQLAAVSARTENQRAYLQLPPNEPALEALEKLAQDLTRGASHDLERVVAVLRHLRALDYELVDTSFVGTRGLAEFAERGSGYCTHFASTAALLLRLVDVPARVAVGYLAREKDEVGGWIVRDRDAHAWLEVPFAGYGWLTFDPTPAGERGGGASDGWSPLSDEPDLFSAAGWWEAARLELELWASGDGGDLVSACAALARGFATSPWGWSLGAGLGALLLLRSRRRTAASAAERTATRSQPQDLHARISRALADRGHRRPPGVPLEAHARALVAGRAAHPHGSSDRREASEPPLHLLPELVRCAYRERFGPGLEPTQLERAQELVKELERSEPERGAV